MERLLYISQGKDPAAHLGNIQRVLDSGCRWVQLRLKALSPAECMPFAEKAKRICDEHNALLTINDHPEVARDVEAYGLHLGLKDMAVNEARRITGDNMIIGGTINTIADVEQRIREGVDYLGLGPLHFTSTKEHLSPILNHKGVREVLDFMKEKEYDVPVLVVGGVTEPDIKALLQAGVYGIGISTLLTQSNFPQELVVKINKDIDEALKNS